MPRGEKGGATLAGATELRDGYQVMTRRVLSRLAEIAATVEQSIRTVRETA